MFRRSVLLWLLLAAVALADEPKLPLDKAKVGQWALYKMANDMKMRQSVVKVEGRKVTIKNEMWIKGQPLPVQETVIDLDKKVEGARPSEQPKTEEETLELNGHSIKCKVQTLQNVKTWIGEDVPITGVVKYEIDGKTVMELVGYGDRPDEDKLKK